MKKESTFTPQSPASIKASNAAFKRFAKHLTAMHEAKPAEAAPQERSETISDLLLNGQINEIKRISANPGPGASYDVITGGTLLTGRDHLIATMARLLETEGSLVRLVSMRSATDE